MKNTSTTNSHPSIEFGVVIIEALGTIAPKFVASMENDKNLNSTFDSLFGNKSKHLISAYRGKNDFGAFLLNLDLECKVSLYNHLFGGAFNFDLPAFENWKMLGKKYFKDQFNEELMTTDDVRSWAVGFKDKSSWEVYPASMVWLDRFALYANNTSISGYGYSGVPDIYNEFQSYEGDKFGNLMNWIAFWNYASHDAKTAILRHLFKEDSDI